MYFPYLRGRQYELIALRELISNGKLSDKIVPIIEPVKITPAVLNTISAFNSSNKKFIIIRNPSVGTFISDSTKEKNADIFKNIQDELTSDNAYAGLIITSKSIEDVRRLFEKGVQYDKMIALCLNSDEIENLEFAFRDNNPKYSIIPYSPAFRRVRKGERVMIDDKFNKLPRNNDYLDCEDEFFSDDHIYCYDDGYKGFSDYSIVGKEYFESGFAPYAVAIHIVYPTAEQGKPLRIHHFVSDSNNDIFDPANKFYEALTKLVEWNKDKKLDTLAMQKFEEMYKNETYPGLGVVKELSIMHHIELMGRILNEVQ